ncbi:cadherin-like and PC-esterase domain-containing protein 1 [Trichonephila clavipes]|nr:cadherin-like and PC-esterase domain-containing protein 1 [Trichonephila clavipes]
MRRKRFEDHWFLIRIKAAIAEGLWLQIRHVCSMRLFVGSSLGITKNQPCSETNAIDMICLGSKPSRGRGVEVLRIGAISQVNRIPGIRNVLWQKDSLCTTTNTAKKIPSLMNSQPAPPCFVLPVQYQEFVNVAEALGYTSQWLLKPLTAVSGPRLVDIFSPVGQAEIDEFSRRRAVAQQMVNNPFTVFGQPVSIRLYVLVTSMLPLRAYVHSQGIVYHRYNESKNFKKIPGRTWPLSQFWQYVSKNYGFDAVTSAIHHVHQTIVHMLLLAELSMMAAPSDDIVSGLGRRFK